MQPLWSFRLLPSGLGKLVGRLNGQEAAWVFFPGELESTRDPWALVSAASRTLRARFLEA
jgi:hypothetical protein